MQGQAIIKLTEKKDKDKALASGLNFVTPNGICRKIDNNGYRKSLQFIKTHFYHFCIEKKLVLVTILLLGLKP